VITKSKIKELKLLQQKKCRETEMRYIVEGIKIVNEAIIYHPEVVEEVFYTSAIEEKIRLNAQITSVKVDQDLINKISSLITPQPCLAVLKIPDRETFSFSKSDDIVLALDSIRDPGNMGTIIRLADWFGISKIVCSPDSVDCYNPKVVQASMGAIIRITVFYKELELVIEKAKSEKISIYGATLEGENIYKSELSLPAIIVMGNESEGISKKISPLLTKEISIPNYSSKPEKTESLNVSTATSVILGEFRRIQNYSK
jgi:TrmH family RNA methyltransferase